MKIEVKYFQDQIEGNHCFGCSPINPLGLQIKSSWDEDVSRCEFHPLPHHCAAPTKFLNGGIMATIIDCHCVCTAIAQGYKKADREIGSGDAIWYATSKLDLIYKRAVAIDLTVFMEAVIIS